MSWRLFNNVCSPAFSNASMYLSSGINNLHCTFLLTFEIVSEIVWKGIVVYLA